MKFTTDPNFNHPFFKDIVRIDYPDGAPKQLINDFGYSYLMFRYGDFETAVLDKYKIEIPNAFVKPTGDYFSVVAPKGGTWISLEMPTTYFHSLTGLETASYMNKLVDLSLFLPGAKIKSLLSDLLPAYDLQQLIDIVDTAFGSYYDEWSQPTPAQEIVTFIYQQNGLLNLEDLLDQFPQSKRTLERLFRTWVGIPPYRFIKLVRFNFIIRDFLEGSKPLAQLIADYNYYDHSHFEKDFRKFMGQSIREYNNIFNPLLTEALNRAYI